jgi:site-specific DNA-methyltransferase (adenine-specific)
MTLHYTDDRATIYHGDCIEVMRTLPDNSVDAVVTDPPYGLEFMGKDWDAPWKQAGDVIADPASVGGFQDGAGGNPFSRSRIRYGREDGASIGFQLWFTDVATEALRVLKPGGHLLAFGGTRTWHRLAVAIEDAGFEVRDSIAWMYGSGFPKSHDVSKGIDKAAGVEREVLGTRTLKDIRGGNYNGPQPTMEHNDTAPPTPAAQQWQGWGTALKPAHEPIVVARKPLIGTVAANVLRHGTWALNIDGCRIGMSSDDAAKSANNWKPQGYESKDNIYDIGTKVIATEQNLTGRWPANVILDESQAAALDAQSGVTSSPTRVTRGPDRNPSSFSLRTEAEVADCYGDSGGASRFFYIAKASSSERPREDGIAHPTVKPLRLMEYLCRLVTPPGGTILEPFAGSGTTIEAALNEGFNVIGIEMTDEYLPLIIERIQRHGEKLW